ncbi:hypothetical protein EYC59_00700 [Candidatus Saccharibacteria bacterium]|nr:MAG: hypothetical protein EYC59_00700 [Candidatus Saccharibacteria bacterium]
MDKRFWAIIGVIVVIFGGLVFYNNTKKDTSSSQNNSSTGATNHVKGNQSSKVTLVEYGDYQCPACESFNPTVDAVYEKYQDKIKFQFRNLPLTQIHQNAFAGARAAEAADLQGKFWEMHDTLYASSNWQVWSTAQDPKPYFWNYAKNLGLDEAKFKTDFASSTVNSRINADMAAFDETGEQKSTPTFFINGVVVKNSDLLDSNNQPSLEKFSAVIDAALAKNQ